MINHLLHTYKTSYKLHQDTILIGATMGFEISEGVPLPLNSGRPKKYDIPLDSMKTGDHIHIGLPKQKIEKETKIIRNFVLRYRHKNPHKKFTVRQMDDGVGIWRL